MDIKRTGKERGSHNREKQREKNGQGEEFEESNAYLLQRLSHCIQINYNVMVLMQNAYLFVFTLTPQNYVS